METVMNRSKLLPSLIFTIVVLMAGSLSAQVPSVIAYQGRLTGSGGTPLTGSYSLTFTIYRDSLGTYSLWNEQHTAVAVTDGLFNVKLGSVSSFPTDLFSAPNRFLGISVNHAAELQPLTRFNAVPYALNAGSITGGEQITLESSSGDVTTIGAGSNVLSAYNDLGRLRLKIGLDPAVTGSPEIGPIDGGGAVSIYDNDGDLRIRMGLDNPSSPSALARVLPIDGGGAVSFYRRATARSGEAIYDKLAEFGEEGLVLFGATESDTTAKLTSAGDLFSSGTVTFGSGSSSGAYGTTIFGINNIANDSLMTISGGKDNSGFWGSHAVISGGLNNEVSGYFSVIGGGRDNVILGGDYSVIPGGYQNTVEGNYSWGGGLGASVGFDGCFVWTDSDTIQGPATASADNQFIVKALGGVGFNTNVPKAGLHAKAIDSIAGYFESGYYTGAGRGLVGRYTYTGNSDGIGVEGYAVPNDYYGVGGSFVGGYIGVQAAVEPTGSNSYFGLYSTAVGGSGTNYGVYGSASGSGTNYAGYFNGNTHVVGTFTATTKSFKIDHPLYPTSRYLYHSCVESPEMKNVYDGVVTLDSRGEATVTLPDYFEALNTKFRYQLTCIGGYAPVYIAQKISGNQFVIAGGNPGLEVSWQVTGVRHDAYATAHPMQTEVLKASQNRGKYLNPEEFGASPEMGEAYIDNQKLNEQERQ